MPYQISQDPRLEFSPVCRGILLINVVVFVLVEVAQFFEIPALQKQELFLTIGLFPPSLFQNGIYWGPFTHMFLHANLLHVGINMMGLYLLGPDLESALGHVRFCFFYLISGLVGAGTYLCISYVLQGQVQPVVGASGAIFGLLGGVVALYPLRMYVILPLMIPLKAYVLAVILLTTHLFFILTPFGSNVAYDVHLGGGVAGFLMAGGAALLHRRKYRDLIPTPELPYAKVELETLACRLAETEEVSESDRSRYQDLRQILRFEDIPSVEELRAMKKEPKKKE